MINDHNIDVWFMPTLHCIVGKNCKSSNKRWWYLHGAPSFWKTKMWFFFEMCFHFQNVKGFVSVVFPFSEKHNCKQKSVHSLQIALLMRLWTNNEIYIKLLNLFQLSRIYNLLYVSLSKSLCIKYNLFDIGCTYVWKHAS